MFQPILLHLPFILAIAFLCPAYFHFAHVQSIFQVLRILLEILSVLHIPQVDSLSCIFLALWIKFRLSNKTYRAMEFGSHVLFWFLPVFSSFCHKTSRSFSEIPIIFLPQIPFHAVLSLCSSLLPKSSPSDLSRKVTSSDSVLDFLLSLSVKTLYLPCLPDNSVLY